MKPLILHQDAEAEIEHEVGYYEAKAPGLGLDFLAEIERLFSQIPRSPKQWPIRRHGTRRALMKRFPHSIFYLELPSALWIVAVAGQRRRPFYWSRRLADPPESPA